MCLFHTLKAQDTLYHKFDEGFSISEWNIPKNSAKSYYVMEIVDSLKRPVEMYFYYYMGKNRRVLIDNPEIVLFKYSDNIIDIYETYSNDTDYSLWESEEFHSLHIRITIDSNGQVTDYYSCSSVDTLRMAEYFNKIGRKSNICESRIFIEYNKCKVLEIPYFEYSYYGINKSIKQD